MPPLSSPALYYGLLVGGLALGLMTLAWRRPRQRQRVLRALASGAAVAALWCCAFPPLRRQPAARAEAIVLTDGYSPDTLRQLRQRLGAGTAVWYYGRAGTPRPARPLTSLLTLAEQRPALRRVHVLGQGLAAAELPVLGTAAVQWHPGRAFAGFQTAFWNSRLVLGQTLELEGTVAADTRRPVWVGLRAAGTVRDSVVLPTGGGAFRLRYHPKTVGLVCYDLLLRRADRVLATEPVPVEVTPPVRPAVLLLAATPSFELRFLKSFLGEAHYPVALRTSVSRGLVQTDFVNQPAQSLDRLTPALLARYGVVVADAATLAALPSPETQALQAAVRAGRLGLVTLAEAAPLPRAAPARADFTVLARPAAQATPQLLAWPEAPGAPRAPLPAQLRASSAIRPLVTGPNRAVAAASCRVGLGFVVVSAVPETFRWVLQGNTPVYASFWNLLLMAAGPPARPAAAWRTGTRWARPAQPLMLHLTGSLPASPPTVAPLAGGPAVRLALREDVRLPEWSTASYWPAAAGWHQVRGPGRTAFSFYVYPAGAWPGPEQLERRQAAALHGAVRTSTAAIADTASVPWPVGWFFGLFLLAAGYLWLEEKL
jgi:hypothetical protein